MILKNPTLPSPRDCFWCLDSSLSSLLEGVLLLCLIKLLLLKTTLCLSIEFFPSRGQEPRSHRSTGNMGMAEKAPGTTRPEGAETDRQQPKMVRAAPPYPLPTGWHRTG